MAKLTIDSVDLRNKRVLVRLDLNVPLSRDADAHVLVADDSRIRAALPTIRAINSAGGTAILMSHLGRPGGEKKKELTLQPVADHLAHLLNLPVTFVPDLVGEDAQRTVADAVPGEIILLENTRFYPGETVNSPNLADSLARLGDVFINDAFGAAHRAHASTAGVARRMSVSAMGYLMAKEIAFLERLTAKPDRPFTGILGGAKVSDKIALIEHLLTKVDSLLIGGAMAYTFLKAQGHETGKSLVERDYLPMASSLLSASGEKLILPVDHVVATSFSNSVGSRVSGIDMNPDEIGLDIGPRSQELYRDHILSAQTLVWNGPMGVFEMSNFEAGTMGIAQAMADATGKGALSVVGGGDSVAAIQQAGLAGQVSHVSTGGGAMLEFLQGKILPGIEALTDLPD